MPFTADEVAFLTVEDTPETSGDAMTHAAISTVAADGQPDVVAVSYEFDGTYLYIGGLNQLLTRKYRNVKAGNEKVAIFIQRRPQGLWSLQWMRIYGTADLVERKGRFDSVATYGVEDRDSSQYIRITPTISWGFNLEAKEFAEFNVEDYANRNTVKRNDH